MIAMKHPTSFGVLIQGAGVIVFGHPVWMVRIISTEPEDTAGMPMSRDTLAIQPDLAVRKIPVADIHPGVSDDAAVRNKCGSMVQPTLLKMISLFHLDMAVLLGL